MLRIITSPWSFLALLGQSIHLAFSQIWSNKFRSFLTMLGIMIGVGAVTAVIAGLTGMKTFVLNQFQSFGANKLYVVPDRPESGRLKNASWRQIMFEPDLFDGWESACPSVDALTRFENFSAILRVNGQIVPDGEVGAVEPDWHKIENREIAIGRTFSDLDQKEGRPVCLISQRVRDRLRLDRDCTGQSVLINDRRFVVVGILEDKPQSGMRDQSSQNEIFIPFNTGWKMQKTFMYVMANTKSPELAQDARSELRAFLRGRRSLRPEDPDTFRIEVMQQFIDQFKELSKVVTTIAVGIVAVSLLVGGIGIMNIMLVSVSERTREIGLRKAVGALPSTVMLQFLVEAITLCCVGGAIGLLIGEALVIGLHNIPNINLSDAYIPFWAIILAFVFSATVGIVFGMFPAVKGALLDPIEALRHD